MPCPLMSLFCGCTVWLVQLRQLHPLKIVQLAWLVHLETSAPPERLLNEYLLNLAVSGANDVQTLLELVKLNAVNCEELCLTISNLSVD